MVESPLFDPEASTVSSSTSQDLQWHSGQMVVNSCVKNQALVHGLNPMNFGIVILEYDDEIHHLTWLLGEKKKTPHWIIWG